GMCASYSEAIGVSCFRYRDGKIADFEHIRPVDGLTSGMAYFLGEDRARRLWVGTGDGVDVVTPGGIDHFDESDGLAGNDSAASAYLVDGDGSLWLGSTGGAAPVDTQAYDGPPRPPAAHRVPRWPARRAIDHPARGGARDPARSQRADRRVRVGQHARSQARRVPGPAVAARDRMEHHPPAPGALSGAAAGQLSLRG